MAGTYYIGAVATIGLVLVVVGILDLQMHLWYQPTITDWLRDHPAWFILPACSTVLFLALLGLHLFAE